MYIVLYEGSCTAEQPVATSLDEALAQCQEYENPILVLSIEPGRRVMNASQAVALLWLEELLDDGWRDGPDDAPVPDFIEAHIRRVDLDDIIQDAIYGDER